MTNIAGVPYLISTKEITGALEKSPGFLMLASPIDNEFLFLALGAHQKESIVAIADDQQKVIIASSHADLIPADAKISDLKEKYLITGKSFFDYGASDLRINFLSLISRSKYQELGEKIMATGKLQRNFASLVLILSFLIIIFWITGKIKKLTRRVVIFSEENLGATSQLNRRGDELMVLEESFELFTNEIITAQNKLKQKVKTLSGFLPICASCKNIRDDNGYWNQIEEYIRDHSEAEFSHGICPDCAKKLYPELNLSQKQKRS
jgi:nitrogen fixation/metabolism regulation signal transduction histidine kinase